MALKNISIGFSSSTKALPIFCWLIKLSQGTKFSHVYVKSSTRYGIDLIYQASGHAVNFMNDKVFFTKNETVREFEFNISDESFDNYMKFALSNVGKPYSLISIFGFLLMRILSLSNNPFPNGRSSYVCSELVADILNEASLMKYTKEQVESSTPKDIYNACLNLEYINK